MGILVRVDWLMVFRIILIAGLIVMVLFILYRQLIRKMKMRISTEKFAFLGPVESDEHGVPLAVTIELPEADTVIIEVIGNGGVVVVSGKSEKGSGVHRIELNIGKPQQGNYILRMTTRNHRAERKLMIKE